MQVSINDISKDRVYEDEIKYYININEREDVENFIRNVILSQIYDETLKEYTNEKLNSSENATNYHYLNNVNYFMGMRITHNHASLTRGKNNHHHPSYDRFRRDNYYGQTSQRFSDVNKTTFSRYGVKYSEDGGYLGKGSFIHYLASDLTYENASAFYEALVEDGLFDEKYLLSKYLLCVTNITSFNIDITLKIV